MRALLRATVVLGLAATALAGCGQDVDDTRVAPPRLSEAKLIKRSSQAVVQLLVATADEKVSGTGFVISNEGHVLTAAHVLEDATRITARLHDGTRLAATPVAVNSARDVAMLHLENAGKDLVSLPLGNDDPPVANTDALMLNYGGNAQQWGRSSLNVSRLHVAVSEAANLRIGSGQPIYERVTQYGGDMRAGGSGAPVQDPLTGAVTGMFVAGNAESTVGYVLPVDMLRRELPGLQSGTKKTWIGLEAQHVAEIDLAPIYEVYFPPELAAEFAEDVQRLMRRNGVSGLFVDAAAAGRPAGRAGIEFGSIIYRVNGTEVKTMRELYRILESADAGQVLEFEGVNLNFGPGEWWTWETWKVRLTK